MLRVVRSMATIAERLHSLRGEIKNARLIAVSKTKPIEQLIEAYEAGQRDFGENYPGELRDKAASEELAEKCPELKWHFIGTIQKKSLNQILKAPRLTSIQTITSKEQIELIDKKLNRELDVMLQVNTSREEQKGGFVEDEELVEAVKLVQKSKFLRFEGLMTIGSAENSKLAAENGQDNPDFTRLAHLRDLVNEECQPQQCLLSMGMSTDYAKAIEQGADVVRVGSKIFGAREKK